MVVLLLSACSGQPDQTAVQKQKLDPLAYVDPFIGTDGKGKTYPGATVPYGMVQLSPDNGRGGWDWIAGYFYPDNIIAGFSHTHLSGTGAGDLYDISFMPLTRPYRRQQTEGGPARGTIVSSFSHANEQASPGYYQVYLDDYQINVELTAGKRSGLQRYRFDGPQETGIVRLDLGYSRNWDETTATHLEILDSRTIGGYRKSSGWAKDQRVYFVSRFSHPIESHHLELDGKPLAADQASGIELAAEFSFDLTQDSSVLVHTAISSVSIDNARLNLNAEDPDMGFDKKHQQARELWQQELGKIQVQAGEDNLRQFYTALYHSALAPRLYSDVDGRYKGPDGEIHQTTGSPRYEFFSLWDTFRALHPWKTLIDPARNSEMMVSLIDHYQVAGRLPVWIFQGNETDMMMGYHSVPVLVDAFLKGQLSVPGEVILDAALQSATQSAFGLASYQKLGYVPFEERNWNVSLTLEYAFDDWAVARLAQALGREDLYQAFLARSRNYRRHFDPQTGFMRALDHRGHFREPFDADAYHPEDYCEANAWQYSFFVPHDIPGLIALHGGKQGLTEKLDALFNTAQSVEVMPEWISGTIGQYVHGNEPSHHVPYLYQYVDQGHKTQKLVRQVMDELYHTAADGLSGNEDAGQMSAWYLFSALGFYPVDPVSGLYVLGSPQVDRATLALENGRRLEIIAHHQSPQNVYVSQVRFNGQPVTGFTLSHQQLMAGGKLEFTMSPTP
ncbi:GH92 family glycosyl hydrolase [Bowmanella dokdonensis]|uniref:GH92 family glycosyl hydrolase n=2 Tax=Bowmanella dokdonensis TaxID=751969 RepID=A0A939IMF2_9ALTE|nr:GH92 family glycosyl hydrolase [Bowmanella dokdonensis]